MSTLVNFVLGAVLSFFGAHPVESEAILSTDKNATETIEVIAKTPSINQNELFKCNLEG